MIVKFVRKEKDSSIIAKIIENNKNNRRKRAKKESWNRLGDIIKK